MFPYLQPAEAGDMYIPEDLMPTGHANQHKPQPTRAAASPRHPRERGRTGSPGERHYTLVVVVVVVVVV